MKKPTNATVAVAFAVAGAIAMGVYDKYSVNSNGGIVETKPIARPTTLLATPLVPLTDTAYDIGQTMRVASASSSLGTPVMTEPITICPQYRGGGICTATPHFKAQCSDPLIAEAKRTPTVWELWCMDGNVEVRQEGTFPPPAVPPPDGLPRPDYWGGAKRVSMMKSASATASSIPPPTRCEVTLLADPVSGSCGWYRAASDDYAAPRVAVGGQPALVPAVHGKVHFA